MIGTVTSLDLDSTSRDLILRVMISMAAADGDIADVESATICAVFEAITGERAVEAEVDAAVSAYEKRRTNIADDLAGAAPSLDKSIKEGIVRAAYLVLRADGRVAARERKKLVDIAHALKMPEIHISAILEDLEP